MFRLGDPNLNLHLLLLGGEACYKVTCIFVVNLPFFCRFMGMSWDFFLMMGTNQTN